MDEETNVFVDGKRIVEEWKESVETRRHYWFVAPLGIRTVWITRCVAEPQTALLQHDGARATWIGAISPSRRRCCARPRSLLQGTAERIARQPAARRRGSAWSADLPLSEPHQRLGPTSLRANIRETPRDCEFFVEGDDGAHLGRRSVVTSLFLFRNWVVHEGRVVRSDDTDQDALELVRRVLESRIARLIQRSQ